jgi:hypothetical protein
MLRTNKGIQAYVVTLLLCSLTHAADKSTALFNGQNLYGWTYHLADPKVPPGDVWSVKDGVLRCTGKPTGYLLTKRNDFGNCVLTLQWRWPEKGGNNGVLVHVTTPNELGVWPKSLEVQLQSGDAGELWVIGTTLQVQNPATHVDDRRHKNIIRGAEKPLGEWNMMEITCVDDEIDVKVNGYLVNAATKLSQRRGAIGLQSEGTPIEFRKISLQPLSPIATRERQVKRQQQHQLQKQPGGSSPQRPVR